MSAPAIRTRHLRLANGLCVTLREAPGSRQAAALARVAAGSHDEPRAHPGLAHFLEHLLFLDSAGYRQDQRLMPWVQRRGGRLNASTQACSSEYFCEVPAADLREALARLLDMLAQPLLDPDAQRSEREVLEAEYLARSRDADTLIDAALACAVASGHPLRRFVAGRRSSLALESTAFQAALRDFHRRYYQPGNLHLWLQGPQPLDELQALVEGLASAWAGAAPPDRAAPPALSPGTAGDKALRLPGVPRLVLGFAAGELDARAEATLEALAARLRDEAPGGLLAWLGARGLVERADLRVLYRGPGQSLLRLTFELLASGCEAQVEAAFFDWLRGVREQAAVALCAPAEADAPLEQLRLAARGLPTAPVADWLATLERQAPIRLYIAADAVGNATEAAGFPLCLGPAARPRVTIEAQPWRFAPALPAGEAPAGLLGLRWRFPQAPGRAYFLALHEALRPLIAEARRQAVDLRFAAQGGDWSLCLHGPGERLGGLLANALACLQAPPPALLERREELLLRERQRRAAELPIRQLLAALPEVLGGAASAAPDWARARWDLLTRDCRLPAHCVPPGIRSERLPAPRGAAGLHPWRYAGEGEAAVLLFCPLPACEGPGEARWRALARALEPAFQQRLRNELQLGYALYCGFRQVGAWRGILFAVQSPCAEPEALFAHLQDFLHAFTPQACLPGDAGGDPGDSAEQAWHDHLAGVAADPAERRAASPLGAADLRQARQALLAASGGWWLLANRA